jgi:hypothetical protein
MEVALWMKGDKGTMLAGSIKPAREAGERQRDDFRAGSPAPVAGGVHKFPDDDLPPW